MPYSPMELAEAFLKTGELDDAVEVIKQQLDQYPDDDEARRLYIEVQSRLLDESTIADLLHEFNSLREKTVADWQLQSTIHEKSGSTILAIEAIHQALKLQPNDERLSERLLDLLLANKLYEDALSLVRKQQRSWRWLEREGDVLALLGDDRLATARYGLVLSHLEQLADTIREDYLNALKARVILARAHAYRRLDHIDIAREHYLQAKSLVGDDPTIDFNLGVLAFLNGDEEGAKALCQQALARASDTLRQTMIESLQANPDWHNLQQELTR